MDPKSCHRRHKGKYYLETPASTIFILHNVTPSYITHVQNKKKITMAILHWEHAMSCDKTISQIHYLNFFDKINFM